ncbi:MAG TPA: YsnF/AvaK domain-containing protein [Candidatus Limnocylindrales bacterium]|nr:YsnF/AvaK domain-containing protein [Candidatus Limnocylindrales bacterium]
MQNYDQIQPGWDAIDRSGDKIGSIEEVGSNYFLVTKGLIFVKDVYVPFQAIDSTDPNEQLVQLNVGKGEIDSQGWDEPPTDGQMAGSTSGSSSMGSASNEYSGSTSASGGGYESYSDQSQASGDTFRVPVREERLQAERRQEQAGEVTVGKNVVEEQKDLDVPVTRDEVQVRRVAMDRAADGDANAFSDGDTIRVPVTAEKLDVGKETRVVEEIEVSKRPVTETQRVSDTVRREQVDVNESGDVLTGAGSRSVGAGDEWQEGTTRSGAERTTEDDLR